MVAQDEIWNVIPLFILFREAIEASIIVSVLISFVRRMNARQLEKQVWWGVGLAVVASIIFGIIFIVVYYEASSNLFQGRNQLIFKGIVSWIASLMITLLAFAMLRFMGWEAKWQRRLKAMAEKEAAQLQRKVDAEQGLASSTSNSSEEDLKKIPPVEGSPGSPARTPTSSDKEGTTTKLQQGWHKLQQGWATLRSKLPTWLGGSTPIDTIAIDESELSWAQKYAFFIAVFLTVVREGLESVVFLAGVGNTQPTAIALPGVVGLICGICFGIALYYSGKTVKHIKWLFVGMALVLFFIAAGQAEMGADWLMKADVFGKYYPGELVVVSTGAAQAFGDGDEVYDAGGTDDGYGALDLRPWWMRTLWDVSRCCADTDEKNKFLSLMKAIFGYNAKPVFIDVIAYCGYWVLAIAFAVLKFEKRTLFDADYKHNKMLREQAKAAADVAAIAASKGIVVEVAQAEPITVASEEKK